MRGMAFKARLVKSFRRLSRTRGSFASPALLFASMYFSRSSGGLNAPEALSLQEQRGSDAYWLPQDTRAYFLFDELKLRHNRAKTIVAMTTVATIKPRDPPKRSLCKICSDPSELPASAIFYNTIRIQKLPSQEDDQTVPVRWASSQRTFTT